MSAPRSPFPFPVIDDTNEWIVGTYPVDGGDLPTGERFEREALLWTNAAGRPLGIDPQGGPLTPPRVQSSYDQAVATASQGGAPVVPTTIRTASAEILVALQGYVPETVDLHLAETPEIDALGAELQGHVNKLGTPRPQLGRDEEAAMPGPGLFRAAAAYHRRTPWRIFPSDQDIVLFSVPALGVHEAVLSVMGQDGEDSGLLLFFSLADFEAYVAAAVNDAGVFSRDGADIDKDKLPAHLALTFDAAKHIPPELRKIVRARRWELANEDAYPAVMAVDAGMRARQPKKWEQLLLEIAALGFAAFLEDESAVRRAYRTDSFHEDEFTLETSQGPLVALLGGPVGAEEEEDDDDDEEREAEDESGPKGEAPNEDHAAFVACQELVDGFAESDEADPFFDVSAATAVLLEAWRTQRVRPEAIEPRHLAEVLLGVYPREAAIPPQVAPEIVGVLRAFFGWLAREKDTPAPHAAACATSLDDDLMRKLWAGLATPALWDPAKRPAMEGVRLLPVPAKAKPAGPVSQSEKNKRKAARKKR